jgi:hypothetical protein
VRETASLEVCVSELVSLYHEAIAEHRAARPVSRRREAWAAGRALRAAGAPSTWRVRLARLPLVGAMLLALRRTLDGIPLLE